MKNVIAVLHIYKNGTTTLVDRYSHNKRFIYVRTSDEAILNHNSSSIPSTNVPLKVVAHYDPGILLGHGITFDNLSLNSMQSVKYVTILRNPIERMLSAYNYYLLELYTLWGRKASYVDFYTWFINKNRILPTPCHYQYEHFITPRVDLLKKMYGGAVDNSPIMTDHKKEINKVEQAWIDKQLYEDVNKALELVEENCAHVLFMDDDYINKFDQLVTKYEINCTPNEEVKHTHNTKADLKWIGRKYISYEDLDEANKQLLKDHLKTEWFFYNRCKEIFSNE